MQKDPYALCFYQVRFQEDGWDLSQIPQPEEWPDAPRPTRVTTRGLLHAQVTFVCSSDPTVFVEGLDYQAEWDDVDALRDDPRFDALVNHWDSHLVCVDRADDYYRCYDVLDGWGRGDPVVPKVGQHFIAVSEPWYGDPVDTEEEQRDRAREYAFGCHLA